MTKDNKYNICNRLVNAVKQNSFNGPYYIFDIPQFERDLSFLKSAYSELPTHLAYSYKTNYLKPLIKQIDQNNLFSEIVSPFELDIAMLMDIDPSKIIYNGPLKSFESIKKVINLGGLVNADSIDDLNLICHVIKTLNKPYDFRVGIRFSFEEQGLNSRFGITFNERNIEIIMNKINHANARLSCLHFHYPERDFAIHKKRLSITLPLISSFINDYDLNLDFIDIGGSLPSYQELLDPTKIKKGEYPYEKYASFLVDCRKKFNLQKIPFCLEPGTALAANSLHLVGEIFSCNKKENLNYLNSNVSKSDYGSLTKSYNFPITFLSKANKKEPFYGSENKLCAFTCVEGDILTNSFNNVPLHSLFIISAIGSYGTVFKSPFIRPDIDLFVWDGYELEHIKRAQNAEDIMNFYS